MKIKLPTELDYLQPFVNYLESLDPEEVDESVDLNLLHQALKSRVTRLSIKNACAKLNNDKSILENWLVKNNDHVALFISAYLEISDEFIKIIRKAKSTKSKKKAVNKTVKFTAETPEGFEVDKSINFLMFTKQNIQPSICVIHLSVLTTVELNGLCAIEEYIQKTTITTPNSEIEFYEWGERDNYQFIKNDINFLLDVQSLNHELDTNIIIKIIDSIEILH